MNDNENNDDDTNNNTSANSLIIIRRSRGEQVPYGQFSKCHVCFYGLDYGNLKFETVRTNKQHICF